MSASTEGREVEREVGRFSRGWKVGRDRLGALAVVRWKAEA